MASAKEIRQLADSALAIGELRRGQLEAIEALLEGHETLAVMSTGYGKSAIYQQLELSQTKVLGAINRLEEAGLAAGRRGRRGGAAPRRAAAGRGDRGRRAASEERREFDRSRLEMMRSYAEHGGCRRDFLLSYFGEEHEPPCGNCEAGLVEADTAERPFEIGAGVSHRRWGDGEVQRYDGERVIVRFESVGYKTLDLGLLAGNQVLEESG